MGINRQRVALTPIDTNTLRQEANMYMKNYKLLNGLRKAYLRGKITADELITLRKMVKDGNADGAVRTWGKLMMREVYHG